MVSTPLKIYGIFIISVVLMFGMGLDTRAQQASHDLPLSFDDRERIASPDLGAVARLRFLTTVDFPPFNFIDQSGRLSGFHVDLAREICRVLDIEAKCQIQALAFADLQPALIGGQGEAVIAGLAVTSQLRDRFAFTRPFMHLPARFAANRTLSPSVDAVLSRPVGVVAGTTHEAMLKTFFPDAKPEPFASRAAMLSALKSGTVAAVFSDGLQLAFWTGGPAAAGCCTLVDGAFFSQRFLGEGLSIMTRKDDPALTQALDHALLDLSRTGRLNEIYLRYFPIGIY